MTPKRLAIYAEADRKNDAIAAVASNPRQREGYSNWDMLGDAEGFVVVFPAGTGFPLRWNSGLFDAAEDAVNDVQFHLRADRSGGDRPVH